jgi:hypothetical protein
VAAVGAVVVLGGPVYRVQTKMNIKLVDRRERKKKKTHEGLGTHRAPPAPSILVLRIVFTASTCHLPRIHAGCGGCGVVGVVFGSRSSL